MVRPRRWAARPHQGLQIKGSSFAVLFCFFKGSSFDFVLEAKEGPSKKRPHGSFLNVVSVFICKALVKLVY